MTLSTWTYTEADDDDDTSWDGLGRDDFYLNSKMERDLWNWMSSVSQVSDDELARDLWEHRRADESEEIIPVAYVMDEV